MKFKELEYKDGMIFRNGRRVGKSINNHGYHVYKYKGKMWMVHRIIWYMHHRSWPKYQIDHINRDPLDNRIENLRDVKQSINMRNRNGIKGYRKKGKRFQAGYRLNGKFNYIGTFDTEKEAHAAYLSATRKL